MWQIGSADLIRSLYWRHISASPNAGKSPLQIVFEGIVNHGILTRVNKSDKISDGGFTTE
jgi:hypothetical protein